jgi:Domain of unknown function (DUF4188)
MAKPIPGRFTADLGGDPDREVVVFLIGMRINKVWKVWRWWPVLVAMPRMLRRLAKEPEVGLLHARLALSSPRSPMVIQYWRSFADLERFARDPDQPHLEAWRAFNRRVGSGGDVGIWHETYRVQPGSWAAIYNNMPVTGLAAATSHVDVARRGDTASERMVGPSSEAGAGAP